MRGFYLEFVWIVAFSALSLWTMYSDIRYRVIPNTLIVCVLITVIIFCIQSASLNQCLYSIPVLIIGLVLWRLGVVGAGDVKLLVAFIPAVDPIFHVFTFLIIAFSGGIVAVITFLYAKLIKKKKYSDITVPYGVSIALGCWLGILASL